MDKSAHDIELRRSIHIFISHTGRDLATAHKYEAIFKENGFSCYMYENRLLHGKNIEKEVAEQIKKCDFFVLIASNAARKSKWVPRELGLALETLRNQNYFRPIIIPITPKGSMKAGQFRDFPIAPYDGAPATASVRRAWRWLQEFLRSPRNAKRRASSLQGAFPLGAIRVFDEARPDLNDVNLLIDQMTPKLQQVGVDIKNPTELNETGFFKLYESTFPEIERIPNGQLNRLLFEKECGIKVNLTNKLRSAGDVCYVYSRKPTLWLLMLNERAIGFSLISYDQTTKFLFGSYLAIHRCWRSANRFEKVSDRIGRQILQQFPENRGLIFEVEPVNLDTIEDIIHRLEADDIPKSALHKTDEDEIRKFLRLIIYKTKALLFLDTGMTPLEYFQPCMDVEKEPREWENGDCPLWLAFADLRRKTRNLTEASQLWSEVVHCVVVEFMGKPYAMDQPSIGVQYLEYTESIRNKALEKSKDKEIWLGCVFKKDDRWWELHRRWDKLNIDVPL